jgi:hypothetical protein
VFPIGNTQQSQYAAENTEQPILRYEKVILGLIMLTVFCLQVRASLLRTFWFDELSTLLVSSTPTLREMSHAIPVDGNPPLYFLLARLCLHFPIQTEIALRLPSIAALDIAALMVFLFVRRNSRACFAFFAMSIFLGSSFGLFAALEARAYALLLCFTSIAIYCWQSAVRGQRRRLALFGITAAMVGAIFSHHYGVIYVFLPLVAGECVRIWRGHRIDYPVFAAMMLGAVSTVITFPPMLHGQAGLLHAVKQSQNFWSRPNLGSLLIYAYTIPKPIPVIVCVVLALGALLRYGIFRKNWKPEREIKQAPLVRTEDSAVGAMLVLILPIMLIVTKIGTGYFWERYAIGAALGIAIVSGLWSAYLSERVLMIGALIPSGIMWGFSVALLNFWLVGPSQGNAGVQSDPLFLSAIAREPTVVADAVIFLPTWWYSDSGTRVRMHYLSDLSYAIRQPDFIPEYTLTQEQPYGAPKLDNYKEFLATHQEFLLYCYGRPRLEWVKERLISDGWHLIPVQSEGAHELYQVIAPAPMK